MVNKVGICVPCQIRSIHLARTHHKYSSNHLDKRTSCTVHPFHYPRNSINVKPFNCPEAQHFEIRTNGRHFVKNHMKSGHKRPDFKWSSHCLSPPICKLGLQKVQISNVSGFSEPHCIVCLDTRKERKKNIGVNSIVFFLFFCPL